MLNLSGITKCVGRLRASRQALLICGQQLKPVTMYSTQPKQTTSGEVMSDYKFSPVVQNVMSELDRSISQRTYGRLFAVVFIHGKQFKVTAEDIIVIQSSMPLDIGAKIILEKVLLVGSSKFTIIGSPLVEKETVRVTATVVEKTLSHESRNFIFERRSPYQRLYFFRYPYTVLRINSVDLIKPPC